MESGLAWLGFWIFLSVFVACDTYVFIQGYESILHSAKTDHEKELHKQKRETK